MKARIAGLGWVTPLGADLDAVFARIEAGEIAERSELANPETGRVHRCHRVPPKTVEHLARNPRLRRSSSISYFAAVASLNALAHAGIEMTPERAARTAVVYAVTDGSVIYTRKFYEQLVRQGAQAASPLLFPETVYNAPASHLAALLGIDGASYTLVGDGATGIAALQLGAQLLALGDVDYCVVAACEELDWILCEAYRDWRFTRMPLSEGAAAVVLAREGKVEITASGAEPFFRQRDAAGALEKALGALTPANAVDFVVSGDNGTFADAAAARAIAKWQPSLSQATAYPKRSLGELGAAGALVNVVHTALRLEKSGSQSALAPVIGLNYQAAAALVSRNQVIG